MELLLNDRKGMIPLIQEDNFPAEVLQKPKWNEWELHNVDYIPIAFSRLSLDSN